MCRLLAAHAEGPEGLGLLARLAGLLHRAAWRDPRLEEAYGYQSHCDGYGYVLLADYGRGWEIHHHRFDAHPAVPGEEEACRANLERLGGEVEALKSLLAHATRALLILHARRATPGTPRGTLYAHPYHATAHTPDGPTEIYLAQNGSVDRQALAAELRLDPSHYTDTQLLTYWIAHRITQGAQPLQALREGIQYTKTAYVTTLLYVPPSGRPLLLYAHHTPEALPPRLRDYYHPHIIKASGLAALASPTIVDYAVDEGLSLRIEEPRETGTLHPGTPG